MNVVAISVAETLLYYMTTIARCVNDSVFRRNTCRSFQYRLQNAEIVVVLLKGQIVYENDKFQGIPVDFAHNERQIA